MISPRPRQSGSLGGDGSDFRVECLDIAQTDS